MKEMIFIGRQFCEEAVRATKGYRNFYFPTNKKKNNSLRVTVEDYQKHPVYIGLFGF